MAKRNSVLPMIPPAGPSPKERAAEARKQDLAACEQELQGLLDKYDATFAVVRVIRTAGDGTERTFFQVEVVSR